MSIGFRWFSNKTKNRRHYCRTDAKKNGKLGEELCLRYNKIERETFEPATELFHGFEVLLERKHFVAKFCRLHEIEVTRSPFHFFFHFRNGFFNLRNRLVSRLLIFGYWNQFFIGRKGMRVMRIVISDIQHRTLREYLLFCFFHGCRYDSVFFVVRNLLLSPAVCLIDGPLHTFRHDVCIKYDETVYISCGTPGCLRERFFIS